MIKAESGPLQRCFFGERVYDLEEIRLADEAWDTAIHAYRTRSLFHESSWLAHLESTRGGQRVLLAIHDGTTHLGYFCGVVVWRGPFQILGSPLRGWWTPTMGPVVDRCDERALLAGLERYCLARKIDYIELCSPFFEPENMWRAGYLAEGGVTYQLRVGSLDQMWHRLKSNARNHIRQAERNGLEVQLASDAVVLAEFYEQLKAVFARKCLTPAHSWEMVYDLWQRLQAAGKLLMLRAVHNGRSVATFLGAWDERALYGLGWASWPSAYALRPNDLIQWKVMTFAAEHGILLYDMCGDGEFKAKFGTELAPRVRWHKALTRTAHVGYNLYKGLWFGRRGLLRSLRQLASSPRLFGA